MSLINQKVTPTCQKDDNDNKIIGRTMEPVVQFPVLSYVQIHLFAPKACSGAMMAPVLKRVPASTGVQLINPFWYAYCLSCVSFLLNKILVP